MLNQKHTLTKAKKTLPRPSKQQKSCNTTSSEEKTERNLEFNPYESTGK